MEKLLVGDYTPMENVKEEKGPGKVIPALDMYVLVILIYGIAGYMGEQWANYRKDRCK